MSSAYLSLDSAKSSQDSKTYQRFQAVVEHTQEGAAVAVTDAESAYSALRLLIPAVADQARQYLDLCIRANVHPDEEKVDRQRARQMVEETIRRALPGGPPDDWMFPESAGGPAATMVKDPAATQS
jgi:hypothetical protein